MHRKYLIIGALFAGLGVAAGAFGAHALEARIAPDLLAVYETAVRYELVHALALLVVGLAVDRWPRAGWERVGWLLVAGTAIFSGSLIALALTGARWLGAVTPAGGLCLLAGWVLAVQSAFRSR